MKEVTRVTIDEQWRDFDKQPNARNWMKRLMDAGITYSSIKSKEVEDK